MEDWHAARRKEGYRPNPKSKYYYNNIYFDSSWELAFYIYCVDHGINIERNTHILKYFVNGKERGYIPDFLVNGEFVEIKGDFLWEFEGGSSFFKNEDLEKEKQRYLCAKENQVKIIYQKDIGVYLKYCEHKFHNKQWKRLFMISKKDANRKREELGW